jgi:hypothetical protein
MANQTVTTVVNFDSDSVLNLNDGETITINGGAVTIDADNRWGQNAAVFSNITVSSTLGGRVLIDGTKIWELPFTDGNGIVPELSSLDTNTLSGDDSLATGEFFRVWASGGLEPLSAGTPMPSAGYVKLRSRTGDFQAGETVVLPGSAATFTAMTSGKRSWINVAARSSTTTTGAAGQLTMPRLGSFNLQGDWYELGVTDGTDDQQIQLPLKEVCGGIQIETAPGSNVYEWWSNAGQKWFRETLGYDYQTSTSSSNLNIQYSTAIADPFNKALEGYEWNETTANAVHRRLFVWNARSDADRYTFSVYLKRDTRQYAMVQITVDTNKKYSVLVNLDDGTATSTDDYNSPQNPSYSIIDAGDGWYKVEVSADHTDSFLIANGGFGTSNSATPTLNATDRFPTFAGSTTQGIFVYKPSLSAHTTEFFSDNDDRGKFFGMTEDGLITLAKRSDGSCGVKPASGCKIRIPNVFLSNATPHDYSRNHIPGFVGRNPRYNFTTTAGGAINITKAVSNWGNNFTGAYEVNYNDCCILDGVYFLNTADRNRVLNCCIGSWSYQNNTPIAVSTNFTGSRIENTRASKCAAHSGGQYVVSLVQSNNTTIKNCRLDVVDSPNSNNSRGNVTTGNGPIVLRSIGCDELLFENNQCIGGQHYIDQTTNSTFKNNEVAAFLNGETVIQTTAIDPYFYFVNSSSNILVDGLSAFNNLQNVYPYGASSGTGSSGLASIVTYSNNITIQNVGTPANPFYTGLSAGDVNATYCIGAMLATTFNVTFRKVYFTATRIRPFLTDNRAQTLLLENVGAKETLATNSATLACNNTLTKGALFYNHSYSPLASVYGTHWADIFRSTTEGQIVISCNEPLEETLDQCSATFGGGGGFTSTGEVSLVTPNQEQIIWTMPYYALGHTSLGYSVSSSNPPFATGSSSNTLQNYEFDYQIDTGSGFSDWKFLFGMRRRASGGVAGGTTVIVDNRTTNREPSAGDFISSTGTTGGNTTIFNTVALGTKITDYDPNTRVITVDTPFLANFASNEQITYWRDIEDETINPNTGVKLKVRVRPTEQDAANSIRFISIPTRTNETDYQIQFPTPVATYTGQITNIVPNSRVQVYNLTKDNEVFNGIIGGTTYSISYGEGNEFENNDLIRARISFVDGLTAMRSFEAVAQASNGWSIFAQQEIDTVYNSIGIDGSTIGEFAADYPNVEVDVQDEDGVTSINRLYAWWVYNEYTAQGIREYFGGLIAEDNSNFKIVTERIDLKLDNVESYGVQFTGDLRLFRDDGQSPVVSTTSGGGSIILYAGKVYNIVTLQSGLTPSESAQIGSLSAIKINTDLIPGIV